MVVLDELGGLGDLLWGDLAFSVEWPDLALLHACVVGEVAKGALASHERALATREFL